MRDLRLFVVPARGHFSGSNRLPCVASKLRSCYEAVCEEKHACTSTLFSSSALLLQNMFVENRFSLFRVPALSRASVPSLSHPCVLLEGACSLFSPDDSLCHMLSHEGKRRSRMRYYVVLSENARSPRLLRRDAISKGRLSCAELFRLLEQRETFSARFQGFAQRW